MTTEANTIPTLQERREMITLLAMDGLKTIGNDPEIVEAALQAICVELLSLTIRVDQEIEPAVKVVSSMVGGLFSSGTEQIPLLATKPSDEDDEDDRVWHALNARLFEQGRRVRGHITRRIGWPTPGGTLESDAAEADK